MSSNIRMEAIAPNDPRKRLDQRLKEVSKAVGTCVKTVEDLHAKCEQIEKMVSKLVWLHPPGIGQYKDLFYQLQKAISKLRMAVSSAAHLNLNELSQNPSDEEHNEDMRTQLKCRDDANLFLNSHYELCCLITTLMTAQGNGGYLMPMVKTPIILFSVSTLLPVCGTGAAFFYVPHKHLILPGILSVALPLIWQHSVRTNIELLASLSRDLERATEYIKPLNIRAL